MRRLLPFRSWILAVSILAVTAPWAAAQPSPPAVPSLLSPQAPPQSGSLCELPYLREQERLKKLYLPAGFRIVKYWQFGPDGFRDSEAGSARKFARVTLAKGRGYLLAASTPLQGPQLVVDALTSTGEVVPLDGTAQIDNREVRFRVNRPCGSFLLMGTLKPALKPSIPPSPEPSPMNGPAGGPPSAEQQAPPPAPQTPGP